MWPVWEGEKQELQTYNETDSKYCCFSTPQAGHGADGKGHGNETLGEGNAAEFGRITICTRVQTR